MPLLFAMLAAGLLAAPAAGETRLGVAGDRFTLNGTPEFLLGISYYGGLGASPENLAADLADLRRLGFNWIRVWATWTALENVSAVHPDGSPREPYLQRLVDLVCACDRVGMVVDVTLHRHKADDERRMLPDLASHLRAVETLCTALRPWRNWYMDLANERDVRDARFVPFDELRQLRDRLKTLDPERLVTASGVPRPDRKALDAYLGIAGLDFVAPHYSRDPASPGQTETRVRELRESTKASGFGAPIHLQEPFRRGYNSWQPKAEDFWTDLSGARRGGAAGWCMHNGSQRKAPGERPRRSFDLTSERLLPQLDAEEQRFLSMLREARQAGSPPGAKKS